MADETYETTFHNKSSVRWEVRERAGRVIAVVDPGDKLTITSYKATTFWSRYASATKLKDGTIDVSLNRKWKAPWDSEWVVECINLTDIDRNIRFLAPNVMGGPNGTITIPAHMPSVLVPVNFDDPLCQFRIIKYAVEDVERKIPGTKYFTTVRDVVCTKIRREQKDLDRILKHREELARKDAERRVQEEMRRYKAQMGEPTEEQPQ